jgi:hypothetical protein
MLERTGNQQHELDSSADPSGRTADIHRRAWAVRPWALESDCEGFSEEWQLLHDILIFDAIEMSLELTLGSYNVARLLFPP